MTKFVFFSLPAHGHVTPSLPIVSELVQRGAAVHYYSLEPFRRSVEQHGAIFHDYGSRFTVPENGPGPFASLGTTVETLLDLTRVVLEDHRDSVTSMHPDCIIHDAFSPWGKYVAQILHLPTVVSVSSIAINQQIAMGGGPAQNGSDEIGRAIAERMPSWKSELANLRERFGVTGVTSPFELMHAYGDLNLVYTSRAFQPCAESFPDEKFKFVGPSIADRHEEPSFPFEALDGRPLLYIALGTVYQDRGPFFRACIEAFADTPWQVVMAVGQNLDTEDLAGLPANFLVRKRVPQIEILKRAALFITHGGMNSVSEALVQNVPLLVVPQGADQFWIARRVAELGVGRSLAELTPAPAILRQSAEQILAEPSYSRAAAEIGESLRTAGGPRRAADEIAAFLGQLPAR